ncbi:MAG: hypothetical protein ABJB16_00225 [Saprospiraceae bacterium]
MKKYVALKSIGVWMDHAEAKLIHPGQPASTMEVFHSPVQTRIRIPGEVPDGTRLGDYRSTNNEFTKHHTLQNEIHSYYKQLAEKLQSYDEILIFGPAPARNEFHNYLLKEKSFAKKRIQVKPVDYITDNQLVEFVRENLV